MALKEVAARPKEVVARPKEVAARPKEVAARPKEDFEAPREERFPIPLPEGFAILQARRGIPNK